LGLNNFFAAYVGGEISREEEEDTETGGTKMTDRKVATLGMRYFLPMSLWAELRVDHEGNFQLTVEREEIPIMQRWRIGGSFEYVLKMTGNTPLVPFILLPSIQPYPLTTIVDLALGVVF
jgi:hypothetical protein